DLPRTPWSPLLPYTTLFRSKRAVAVVGFVTEIVTDFVTPAYDAVNVAGIVPPTARDDTVNAALVDPAGTVTLVLTSSGSVAVRTDRKSTRLNSSHVKISYAV